MVTDSQSVASEQGIQEKSGLGCSKHVSPDTLGLLSPWLRGSLKGVAQSPLKGFLD